MITATTIADELCQTDAERAALAMEHHHEPTAQWSLGNEAEYIRRTDLVDLFPPASVAMRINRGVVRNARARVSTCGTYRVIGALVTKEIRSGGPMAIARIVRP